MPECYLVYCKEIGKYAAKRGKWLGMRNGKRFPSRTAAEKAAATLSDTHNQECIAVSWTFAKQTEALAKKLRK